MIALSAPIDLNYSKLNYTAMKHFNLLKTTLLLCALIVGSLSGWAQVSSVAPSDGNSYVIAAYVNSKYYALPNGSVGGGTINGTEITLNALNKVNTSVAQGKTWTLNEGSTTGQFYIQYTSGSDTYSLYKNGTSTSNHNFAVNKTSKNYWTFTSNGTGYTVAAVGRGTNHLNIKCSSGTFSCDAKATPIILLEVGDVPEYTVTEESNNTFYGTVSKDGFVITASPNSGYRVSTTIPYTISPIGSATVVQNGNQFTVTPSANTTVTINFEEIPAHTISCVASPIEGGSIETASATIREGETTNITATANSGYKFVGWTVTGTGSDLTSTNTNPTTLTMGSADAIVTASFEAVVTHEVKWSVNGLIIKTENVEENQPINFVAPTEGVPAGYTFMGWVAATNKIDTPVDTDPSANYVTSGTSTEDITFYAVMAKLKSASTETVVTLSNKMIKDNATSKTSYSDSYNIDNWTGRYLINNNSGNYTLQLGYNTDKSKGAYNSHLTTPSAENDIMSVTIEASQAVTFYLCSSADLGTADSKEATYGYGSTTSGNKTITINVIGSTKQLFIYPSGTANIKSISMTYGSPAVYDGYCTATPSVSVEVSSAGYATFASDYDLDYSSVAGLKAYKATVSGTTITFDKVTEVPAGEGVLLQGEGTFEVPVKSVDAWAADYNAFVRGTGAAVATGDGPYNYILNKVNGVVGFYKANGQTVAKNRAYLQSTTAAARISLNFDEETTGISEVVKSDVNNKVFDLQGRHIAQPTKGLYIMNGRKVLVK